MNTWSDGVVESWSVGPIRIKAVFQYSNIPIPRLTLCLTLCAFFLALCSSATAQQQARVPKIGWLALRPLSSASGIELFRREIGKLGYIEGKNIAIEYRSADNRHDRLIALGEELVRLKVDVLITPAINETLAAKKITKTIPIVFAGVADPVKSGVVQSLAKPGGNATGFSNIVDIGRKTARVAEGNRPETLPRSDSLESEISRV